MEATEFTALVADAYNHLYDLVSLRTHPLAEMVTPAADLPLKKKAWLLHDVLLGVIEELDPGFHAPPDGREKRRYRLLSMRYSEGSASKAVADALSISLRHYYREHDTAIEAVAAILWQRYGRRYKEANMPPGTTTGATANGPVTNSPVSNSPVTNSMVTNGLDEAPARQAMLRAETAHFHDFGQKTHLGEVLAGVVELAQEMARAKGIHLTLEAPQAVTPLPIERTLLRQIVLGVLSFLGEQLSEGEIVVRVRTQEPQQIVEMVGVGKPMPGSAARSADQHDEQIATLYELAALQSAQLEPLADSQPTSLPEKMEGEEQRFGFALRLPHISRRTVLLVDDNNDILELYQRYLQHRYYHAVAVQSGREALQLASQLRPEAIVLDLMLPEQDGWEVLQRLTNHPDTQSIPVVICSILRARQLAMALGAAAFLEKPVNEEEFLGVLDALTASRQPT